MNRPISAGPVWVILVLLTTGSLAVVESGLVRTISVVVVIGVAAVKVRLIMNSFMELGSLPRAWRLMFTGWVLAASGIIIIGNYVAVLSV